MLTGIGFIIGAFATQIFTEAEGANIGAGILFLIGALCFFVGLGTQASQSNNKKFKLAVKIILAVVIALFVIMVFAPLLLVNFDELGG